MNQSAQNIIVFTFLQHVERVVWNLSYLNNLTEQIVSCLRPVRPKSYLIRRRIRTSRATSLCRGGNKTEKITKLFRHNLITLFASVSNSSMLLYRGL